MGVELPLIFTRGHGYDERGLSYSFLPWHTQVSRNTALKCKTLNLSWEDKVKGSFGEDVVVQHRVLEATPRESIWIYGPILDSTLCHGIERVPKDQRETNNTWNKYATIIVCITVGWQLNCHAHRRA